MRKSDNVTVGTPMSYVAVLYVQDPGRGRLLHRLPRPASCESAYSTATGYKYCIWYHHYLDEYSSQYRYR